MCSKQISPVVRKRNYNDKTISKYRHHQPRPMKRHISDLSWKVGVLKAHSNRRSESISSAPDDNKMAIPCSTSTCSLRTTSVTHRKSSVGSTLDYLENNHILDVPSSDGSESNVMS